MIIGYNPEKNNTAIYYVKKIRLLNYLVARGFTDFKVIPDPTADPTLEKKYNWFVFENTPALQEVLNEYYTSLKERK